MIQLRKRFLAAATIVASPASCLAGAARAAEPITIGFGMALTGGLAAGGKSALLGDADLAGQRQRQGRAAWAGRSS